MNVRINMSPNIRTRCGDVQGKISTFDDHKAASFLGIPYAKPPIGERRFNKPEDADSWTGIRECIRFGAACPHSPLPFAPKVEYNEDCLFLNIFTPLTKEGKIKSNLPVLVYFHGGGFVIGSSADAGDEGICKHLCSRDLIVVTVNYRLGIFGFLATGDENARGNYGLWDQTASLRWVQLNISSFGGDPFNITIFGHSAGAASVELLCLSPHSRDLFQKAIPMGGSSFCNWGFTNPKTTLDKILKFAKVRGFQSDKTGEQRNRELVAYLRSLSWEKLSVGLLGVPSLEGEGYSIHLAPVFDGDFFPKHLEELRREAPKKQILTGITAFEGMVLVGAGRNETLEELALRYLTAVVRNLQAARNILHNLLKPHLSQLNENELFVTILSDLFIGYAHTQMAEAFANCGHTVYLYTFDHISPGGSGPIGRAYPFERAHHGVEMAFIFGTSNISRFVPNHNDRKVMNKFISYFANFAKYGNPNGLSSTKKWKPISNGEIGTHLVIQLNEDKIQSDFCGNRQIWLKVLPYGLRPKL